MALGARRGTKLSRILEVLLGAQLVLSALCNTSDIWKGDAGDRHSGPLLRSRSMVASTCSPGSADGTPCDDGDPCTEGDHCVNGVCAHSELYDCLLHSGSNRQAPCRTFQCQAAGCVEQTSPSRALEDRSEIRCTTPQCVVVPLSDGSSCSYGNDTGTCWEGLCSNEEHAADTQEVETIIIAGLFPTTIRGSVNTVSVMEEIDAFLLAMSDEAPRDEQHLTLSSVRAITINTDGTVEGASTAMKEAADAGSVAVVLRYDDDITSLVPVIEQYQIPVVTYGLSIIPDVSSSYLIQMNPSPLDKGSHMADVALTLGWKSIRVIPATEASGNVAVEQEFLRKTSEWGLNVSTLDLGQVNQRSLDESNNHEMRILEDVTATANDTDSQVENEDSESDGEPPTVFFLEPDELVSLFSGRDAIMHSTLFSGPWLMPDLPLSENVAEGVEGVPLSKMEGALCIRLALSSHNRVEAQSTYARDFQRRFGYRPSEASLYVHDAATVVARSMRLPTKGVGDAVTSEGVMESISGSQVIGATGLVTFAEGRREHFSYNVVNVHDGQLHVVGVSSSDGSVTVEDDLHLSHSPDHGGGGDSGMETPMIILIALGCGVVLATAGGCLYLMLARQVQEEEWWERELTPVANRTREMSPVAKAIQRLGVRFSSANSVRKFDPTDAPLKFPHFSSPSPSKSPTTTTPLSPSSPLPAHTTSPYDQYHELAEERQHLFVENLELEDRISQLEGDVRALCGSDGSSVVEKPPSKDVAVLQKRLATVRKDSASQLSRLAFRVDQERSLHIRQVDFLKTRVGEVMAKYEEATAQWAEATDLSEADTALRLRIQCLEEILDEKESECEMARAKSVAIETERENERKLVEARFSKLERRIRQLSGESQTTPSPESQKLLKRMVSDEVSAGDPSTSGKAAAGSPSSSVSCKKGSPPVSSVAQIPGVQRYLERALSSQRLDSVEETVEAANSEASGALGSQSNSSATPTTPSPTDNNRNNNSNNSNGIRSISPRPGPPEKAKSTNDLPSFMRPVERKTRSPARTKSDTLSPQTSPKLGPMIPKSHPSRQASMPSLSPTTSSRGKITPTKTPPTKRDPMVWDPPPPLPPSATMPSSVASGTSPASTSTSMSTRSMGKKASSYTRLSTTPSPAPLKPADHSSSSVASTPTPLHQLTPNSASQPLLTVNDLETSTSSSLGSLMSPNESLGRRHREAEVKSPERRQKLQRLESAFSKLKKQRQSLLEDTAKEVSRTEKSVSLIQDKILNLPTAMMGESGGGADGSVEEGRSELVRMQREIMQEKAELSKVEQRYGEEDKMISEAVTLLCSGTLKGEEMELMLDGLTRKLRQMSHKLGADKEAFGSRVALWQSKLHSTQRILSKLDPSSAPSFSSTSQTFIPANEKIRRSQLYEEVSKSLSKRKTLTRKHGATRSAWERTVRLLADLKADKQRSEDDLLLASANEDGAVSALEKEKQRFGEELRKLVMSIASSDRHTFRSMQQMKLAMGSYLTYLNQRRLYLSDAKKSGGSNSQAQVSEWREAQISDEEVRLMETMLSHVSMAFSEEVEKGGGPPQKGLTIANLTNAEESAHVAVAVLELVQDVSRMLVTAREASLTKL